MALRSVEDGRKPSFRAVRIAQEIRRGLSRVLMRHNVFQKKSGETLEVSLTITEVQMGKDLRSARVYVSPLSAAGGELDARIFFEEAVLKSLNGGSGALQKLLMREVSLRFCPKLRFYRETAFDHAVKMRSLMQGCPNKAGEEAR